MMAKKSLTLMKAELRQLTHELSERVKELNCLYAISQLVENPDISLEEILQRIVELLPPAWQYPDITCARLIIEGQEFRTKAFSEAPWKLAQDIRVNDKLIGSLEVYYVEEVSESDEDPFLKEERAFINMIAERIGTTIERMRAEEMMSAREQFSSNLLDSSPNPILVINPDNSIRFVNPALEQLSRFSAEELNGHKVPYPWWTEETLQKTSKDFKEAFHNGARRLEQKFKKKNGRRFWVEITSISVRHNGEFKYYIENWIDITEQKRAAIALRKAKKELELRVERRTAELQQEITDCMRGEETLKKYAQELEESNLMKDLIIDIMSHDLLNPAGVTQTSAEMLLEQETDPKKREFLELIRNSASKLIERIENAAKYSKLQQQERIECELLELNTILKKVTHELEYQLEEKQIQVAYFPKLEDEYPIIANLILEDVFLNLISNAVKYSPFGSQIELGIQERDDRWKVSVKDYGPGIDQEDKKKIFRRFERLDKEGVKGTGLGLAIARRIVELHGGKIWVEDNPEGGSIFFVSLPKEARWGGSEVTG